MSKVEAFLNPHEEAEIVEAIRLAEKNTSGEIRVHLESSTFLPAYNRAQEVFNSLKMHQTEQQNGVLIYVAIESKLFAICGDKGINSVVGADFWDSTKNLMEKHFKNNQFKQGLVEGILMAGNELKKYFPWQANDSNEISNELSKGT